MLLWAALLLAVQAGRSIAPAVAAAGEVISVPSLGRFEGSAVSVEGPAAAAEGLAGLVGGTCLPEGGHEEPVAVLEALPGRF